MPRILSPFALSTSAVALVLVGACGQSHEDPFQVRSDAQEVDAPASTDAGSVEDTRRPTDASVPPDAPSSSDAPQCTLAQQAVGGLQGKFRIEPPTEIVAFPIQIAARYNFNDSCGHVAKDLYGHHASLIGQPAWGAGYLVLDGHTLAVTPDNNALDQTGTNGAVSLLVWLRIRNPEATGTVVRRAESDTLFDHFGLRLEGGRPTFSIHSFKLTANVAVPADTWVHVAAVHDGITQSVYVNGVLQGTYDTGWQMAPDVTPLTIGGELNGDEAGHFLTGDLDDLALYHHAVSAGEIAFVARSVPTSL